MSDRLTLYIQSFLYPKGMVKLFILFVILGLEGGCNFIVYETGGTNFSYLHTFYIPIIVAGMAFQLTGGFLAGLIAGLMLGPTMPADVAQGVPQVMVSWVMRSLFFCLMGLFSGMISLFFRMYLKNLHWRLTTDLTTNLLNISGLKLLWQKKLDENLKSPPSILILLLNRLNDIDKAFGAEATALLLKEATKRLQESLPHSVALAYIDYGAFTLIIPSAKDISEIREKCRKGLGNRFLIDDVPIFLESHFGDASPQENENDLLTLIRKAKIAVDKSFDLSRDSATFEILDDGHIQRNLKLIHDLSQAIELKQLKLFYQSKTDLKTTKCIGVEALVRWMHPELGMISPSEFIPMIEKTLLINQFTRWLMETALIHLQSWHHKGFTLVCGLNFSMKNFEDPLLFTELKTLLKQYDIPRGFVEIEVTETAISTNLEKVADILEGCRQEGIKIAIDDYGTGQASMKYLFKLPVDSLKIDQIFIRSMLTNSAAEAIVRSAITLGHELNLDVVAEGIEKEEEYLKLKDLGCDAGQGFYFGRPIPYEMMTSWLESTFLI